MPDRQLRIALAQIRSGREPDANCRLVTDLIAQAADREAQMIAFPEATMACFGTRLIDIAEPWDGPFATAVRSAARDAGIIAVVGMFTPSDDGRVHNSLLITGKGVSARYDKIHMFDAYESQESVTVAPGKDLTIVDACDTRIGFATCFDVRFADHFHQLGSRGAEVIVLSASWASGPGKDDQWDVLTRARAMDSQAYLVACDQSWTHPRAGLALGIGHSRIIGPNGAVISSLDEGSGLLIEDIDLANVRQVREQLPVVQDR